MSFDVSSWRLPIAIVAVLICGLLGLLAGIRRRDARGAIALASVLAIVIALTMLEGWGLPGEPGQIPPSGGVVELTSGSAIPPEEVEKEKPRDLASVETSPPSSSDNKPERPEPNEPAELPPPSKAEDKPPGPSQPPGTPEQPPGEPELPKPTEPSKVEGPVVDPLAKRETETSAPAPAPIPEPKPSAAPEPPPPPVERPAVEPMPTGPKADPPAVAEAKPPEVKAPEPKTPEPKVSEDAAPSAKLPDSASEVVKAPEEPRPATTTTTGPVARVSPSTSTNDQTFIVQNSANDPPVADKTASVTASPNPGLAAIDPKVWSRMIAEVREKVKGAGGQIGDVTVSLRWNNRNDLDLHVVTKEGHEIYFMEKESKCGGILDVDMNVSPRTSEPVENIRWLNGARPTGPIRIYVRHFVNHEHPDGADPTPFTIVVNVGKKEQLFQGQVTWTKERGRFLVAEIPIP